MRAISGVSDSSEAFGEVCKVERLAFGIGGQQKQQVLFANV